MRIENYANGKWTSDDFVMDMDYGIRIVNNGKLSIGNGQLRSLILGTKNPIYKNKLLHQTFLII